MAITQAESGLTTDQYNAFITAKDLAVYEVIAHRWNPEFELDHTTTVGVDKQFSACMHLDTIYRTAMHVCERLVTGAWTGVTGFSTPAAVKNKPYSMASDGSDLFVFAATDAGVALNVYDGSGWTGWATILSNTNVIEMAATAHDTVHFITRDPDNYRYQLHVMVYDGTWDVTSSNIYYPYPIYSFDAKRLNGKDVLVLATEVPGNLSAKYVNNTVVKYTLRAGGIISFTYQYGSWSDHIDIDVLDETTTYRFRKDVRLSLIDDKLYLTCWAGEGDIISSFAFYREYSTTTGRHWSRGEFLPGYQAQTNGVLLFRVEDNLYWIYRTRIYVAESTLKFGHSPTSQQIDISDEITELRISRRDMQQLNMTVDTSTTWFDNSFVKGNEQVIFEVNLGYNLWDDEEEEYVPTMIQVGLFEMDAITPSLELPDDQADISARDYLAWMTTRTQAEQFKMWEPQTIFGDDFSDDTTTGYGGMGHTAVQTGSWRTGFFNIALVSSNDEGIAWNTIISQDNWNATIRVKFRLASVDNDEYAGLVFRAQDKDNFFGCIYFQGDDVLRLIERVEGSDTVLWESSTLSWTALADRYLMVTYHYCRIDMFTSTDGITWTLLDSELVAGKPTTGVSDTGGNVSQTSAFIQSGFNGIIGWGFSDEGNWALDPGPFPAPVLPPSDDSPFLTPIDPLDAPGRYWAVVNLGSPTFDTRVVRLIVDLDGEGEWERVFDDSYSFSGPTLGLTDPFDRDIKYFTHDRALYRGLIWETTPVWTEILPPGVPGNSASAVNNLVAAPTYEGYLMALKTHDAGATTFTYVSKSTDRGDTWDEDAVVSIGDGYSSHLSTGGFSQTAYLTTWAGNSVIYKTNDWGQIWGLRFSSLYSTDPEQESYRIYRTYVPLTRDDGTPNIDTGNVGFEGALEDYVPVTGDEGNQIVYGTGTVLGTSGSDPDEDFYCLFRSDNGCATWTKLGRLPEDSTSIQSRDIYIHPSSALLLAYTTVNYLYRSEDGGVTWDAGTATPSGSLAYKLQGWAHDPLFYTLWNSENDHIYATPDGGANWVPLDPDLNMDIGGDNNESHVWLEAELT